jgi:hypothetical protein
MSAVNPRLMVDDAVTPEGVPPVDDGVEVLADFVLLLQALVAPARRATAATR